jgi:hypothetical protein
LLSLQHQNSAAFVEDSVKSGEKEVKKFPLAKDSLDKMLKDLFSTKDHMPVAVTVSVLGSPF